MSPRRRIEADAPVLFQVPEAAPRQWGPAIAGATAAAAVLAAVTFGGLLFVKQESQRRAAVREVAVVGLVRSFLIQYTSPDPFHANDYANKVLAQGTGQFAKLFADKMNAVVIQIARAEPGIGSVQELGIERWNEDGSADVVAVAKTQTKLPDGTIVENGSRWVVTTMKEGEQWKVSNLVQVI